MRQTIIPNLWFDNQAEEAANFYVSLFGDSAVKNITRYGESGARVAGRPKGSVLTVSFELRGHEFIALNGGPVFSFTPAISLFVDCETAAEVDRLYNALSEKGGVLMPLGSYPFSERYAWISDRYGLSWQLYCGGREHRIAPCLLFVGEHYGRAREAMKFHASVFGASEIVAVVDYGENEGEKAGAVKHADFILDGVRFTAMDSGRDHAFTFTPAISFMVRCGHQETIDYFWKELSAVPEAEQCGWLQDRFGISWQIVPSELEAWMNEADPVKTERMMRTLLRMKKLEIEVLKNAMA